MAGRRRGGRRPQASGSPAARRARRDWRRRRRSLPRHRAARPGHVQPTKRPYTLPARGKQLADNATRTGGAERCPDPAVQQRLDVDLARLASDAPRLGALACHLVTAAKPPAAQTVDRRHPGPGMGNIRSRVWGAASQARARFPRGQAGVSYGRLGTWAKAAAGTRDGTAGPNRGQASLPWAFAAAARRCLRDHPTGQPSLASLAHQHGQGKARTVLAHQLARAVEAMVQRGVVCTLAPLLHRSRGGAGAPAAARGHPGPRLAPGRCNGGCGASTTAPAPRGHVP